MIKFDFNRLNVELIYKTPPVINFTTAFFSTSDEDWAQRVFGTSILVKLTALTVDQQIVGSLEEYVFLNVTPDHVQPVFKINRSFAFPEDLKSWKLEIATWKIEVTLKKLEFRPGETLTVNFEDCTVEH